MQGNGFLDSECFRLNEIAFLPHVLFSTSFHFYRFYWDLLMLVLLIANLIILPVFISFFLEDVGLQAICFNCVSDTIFLLDILVNFRTGELLRCHSESFFFSLLY